MIKSILKPILIGVVLASIVVVGVGLFLPAHYTVTRSVVIDAPTSKVHSYLSDLALWPTWAPWHTADPSLEVTLGTISRGIGANQTWLGDSGDGELVFTRCDPEWGIAFEMALDHGNQQAECTMLYTPVEGGTRVTWEMTGENGLNPFNRYFGLLMKPVFGPMFDEGLARLKLEAEKKPFEADVETPTESL